MAELVDVMSQSLSDSSGRCLVSTTKFTNGKAILSEFQTVFAIVFNVCCSYLLTCGL